MTRVVHAPEELRAACDAARAEGLRVGLVPTMGALHRGHVSLMEEARRRAGFRVVTVFVNPLQFGAGEDLDRYPRTLGADVEHCREHAVDLVFAPEPSRMYPAGFQTHVEVEQLTRLHDGEHRPGHFRGVATVVTKLFNLTGPCVSFFGRKDYQQWKMLERMARDLDLPVEVVGLPIVREPDGLALSSRNVYLGPEQRERALAIARGLSATARAWAAGEREVARLEELASSPIGASFDRIDYVRLVHPDTLEPLEGTAREAVVLVAAHLGTTRLIDNLVLGVDPPPIAT